MSSRSMASVPGHTFPVASRAMDYQRRRKAQYLQRKYDNALPRDHANVHLERWGLRYKYDDKPLDKLDAAFITRNASRYLRLLRICSWMLVCANICFVLYDVLRFETDTDTMEILIIIRFCVILPSCVGIVGYTYSKHYLRRPNWLVLPCLMFGIGLVAYSVIGDDPGYGTLALMIVFMYSFTPMSFFVVSALSFVLITTFVALVFLSSDKPKEELYTVVGMLLLFWVAVGFVGLNLEHQLRRSFLDEVIVRRQRDQLDVEKKLSDRLLANMLPKQIAAQLKADKPVVADEFSSVTVLFCEICDWGAITDQISADSVVTILNKVYSRFDELIEANNVYKVETVGEVYMVVGGCPTRSETHAENCVRMALAMVAELPALRKECERIVGLLGHTLNIRIGLNSGPIVAGIVGIKNPRYKLFGDTVNTASRMESTSVPGRIQVSDKTYPFVCDKFKFTPRGPIKVKGKGMMSTYFVDGPLDDLEFVRQYSGGSLKVGTGNGGNGDKATASQPLLAESGSSPLPKKSGSSNSLHDGNMNGIGHGDGGGGGAGAGAGAGSAAHGGSNGFGSPHGNGGGRTPHFANHGIAAATPSTAEFWAGQGAAATAAARELFAPTPALNDQHLVDILARHDNYDTVTDAEVDAHVAAGLHDSVYIPTDDSDEFPPPPPPPGGPTGGGPNDSRRIPSFTVTTLGPSDHADMAAATTPNHGDMRLEDINSRDGSIVMLEDTKEGPLRDELGTNNPPPRTFSGNRKVAAQGTVSATNLTKLVSIGSGNNVRAVTPTPPVASPHRPTIPPTTLGLTRPTTPSHARSGLRGFISKARSIPHDAGMAVCLYRASDTPMGSMEQYFLKEYMPYWRHFMRISCGLCIIALALFAVRDMFAFDRDVRDERRKHDLIMIIRYAVMVPIILLYLLLTRLQKFKAPPQSSYALVQSLSVLVLLLVGAGIIAVSVIGGEPGFGVLAAYIVYAFNVRLIAYAYRACALAALVAAHMICIMAVNGMSGFEVLEQLGYLCVFYVGQGLPVLGREYYSRDNYIRRQRLLIQKKQLQLETERTDRVLANLLPSAIARQLKDGAKCIAGHFEMATILFTDMKGFTNFSSHISPQQLVGFLNTMYSAFDKIANKYGIHKVEIIGDAYFSVAGCPSTMKDHAERCAAAALEMLEYMPELRRRAGANITMRVGIHTGPLVAGVVGVKDPRYHLFGNTVNLAMAMESNGVPGRVHISAQTYEWLQRRFRTAVDDPSVHEALHRLAGPIEFKYEAREPMTILGHDMQTYFLSKRVDRAHTSFLPGQQTSTRGHA